MPDEMNKTEMSNSEILKNVILFATFSLVLYLVLNPSIQTIKAQPLCDLNSTQDLVLDAIYYEQLHNKFLIDMDTNQHSQLAQLIVQNNYLMQCTIDTNSATTIEVPQADNSYKKYTKFSAVYCPQGGG